jgi:hypothetical protein
MWLHSRLKIILLGWEKSTEYNKYNVNEPLVIQR